MVIDSSKFKTYQFVSRRLLQAALEQKGVTNIITKKHLMNLWFKQYATYDIAAYFLMILQGSVYEYPASNKECPAIIYGYPIVQFHYLNRIVDFFETSNYTPEQSAYYLQKHYEDAILYFIVL